MDENWDCEEPAYTHKRQSSPYREQNKKSYSNNEKKYTDNNFSSYRNSRTSGSERFERSERSERPERSERSERFERSERSSHQYSENLDIHSSDVGKLIGKGGSNIRDLQSKYSVNIKIDRNSNEYGLNSVTVSGDSSAVSKAVSSIREQTENKDQEYHNNSDYNKRQRDTYGSRTSNYNFDTRGQSRRSPSPDNFQPIDWSKLNQQCEEERKKRWAKCPPLIKNFYQESPEVASLTEEEVSQFREENNNITVDRLFKSEGKNLDPIPNPIQRFDQCFSDFPDIMEEIHKQKFTKPSPIQAQAWPVLLKGEDLIGIAQTGTGKTLAFLLPGMIHTELQPVPRNERGGPNVLVLAPTRELALQIEKEVSKYHFRGMKAVCVYGGGDRKQQINLVTSGVEIIIATPGRLNDLVQAKVINVESITYLVLDEADRMLDMGFEPQIRKVLLDIRPDRQTVMTSATWPAGVRRLAQSYMNNPIQVCVGSLDLAAVHTVLQHVEIMDEEEKYQRILEFVDNMDRYDKAIIFCGKKARADDLASEFALKGILCQCIHGDRDQNDREQAIADITSGEVKILIATDVASRGLDIEDISYVINYDFPRNIEEYVHRVGRTGRAGRRGTSISFLTRDDWGAANELISILEEADQEVPEKLREMANRFKQMKERRANEMATHGGGRGSRRGFRGDRGNFRY